MRCPICDEHMQCGVQPWHFICYKCNYEAAALNVSINSEGNHVIFNESERQAGLAELRKKNFADILAVITKIKPENASLLEIGCAHGWFLELAQQYFSVLGVEPDKNLVQQTLSKKLPVLQGYFPEAISDEKRFDIIVFNDVFEHIAGLPALTAACYKHLNDNGLLVINLPTTTGFFYRISKLLVKLKVPGYFERLWQKDSVSPHLHYFNHDNLVSLLKKRGFEIVTRKSLATIAYSGLKQRIFYYNQAGRFFNIIAFLGLLVMLPLIKKLPNDILLLVARKPQYLAASPEPLHDGQGWKTAKTALALDYSQDCK